MEKNNFFDYKDGFTYKIMKIILEEGFDLADSSGRPKTFEEYCKEGVGVVFGILTKEEIIKKEKKFFGLIKYSKDIKIKGNFVGTVVAIGYEKEKGGAIVRLILYGRKNVELIKQLFERVSKKIKIKKLLIELESEDPKEIKSYPWWWSNEIIFSVEE